MSLFGGDVDFEVQENPCWSMTDRGRMPELTKQPNKSLDKFSTTFHFIVRFASTADSRYQDQLRGLKYNSITTILGKISHEQGRNEVKVERVQF